MPSHTGRSPTPPNGNRRVTTSVTLPSDLPPWLDRLADSEQRSRSFVLTAVMRAVRECVGDDPEPGDLRKVLTAMGAGEAA